MKLKDARLIPMIVLATMIAACNQSSEQTADQAKNVARQEAEQARGNAIEVVCTYAPSQSAVVNHVAGLAGGSAAAAAGIAKAAGLTAVLHSSGAYIFTGAGGYIAGTLGTAIAGPAIVGVGIVVGGTAATLELLCAPTNHPELSAKVEAAAREYWERSKGVVVATKDAASPMAVELKAVVIKAGSEAFAYASRKSVEVSDVIRRRTN